MTEANSHFIVIKIVTGIDISQVDPSYSKRHGVRSSISNRRHRHAGVIGAVVDHNNAIDGAGAIKVG